MKNVTMNFNNYLQLINVTYSQCISMLKEKYGSVNGNYFLTDSCKSPNKKIKRTSDGLVLHHDQEIILEQLSDSAVAVKHPFELQYGENLTYANVIEHLILHYLIYKETNGKLSKRGIAHIIVSINGLYEEAENLKGYRQNWYKQIKDDFSFYISFLVNNIKPIFLDKLRVLYMIDCRNPFEIGLKIKNAIIEYEKINILEARSE